MGNDNHKSIHAQSHTESYIYNKKKNKTTPLSRYLKVRLYDHRLDEDFIAGIHTRPWVGYEMLDQVIGNYNDLNSMDDHGDEYGR